MSEEQIFLDEIEESVAAARKACKETTPSGGTRSAALNRCRLDHARHAGLFGLMGLQKAHHGSQQFEITLDHRIALGRLETCFADLKSDYRRPWWAFWRFPENYKLISMS